MTTPSNTLSRCSECGHAHFNAAMKQYEPCPLKDEGCQCPYALGEALPIVLELRATLDAEDIFWMLVRSYPQATYLPEVGHYSIWWDSEMHEFMWGHNFEFHDPDVPAVITRLKGFDNVT